MYKKKEHNSTRVRRDVHSPVIEPTVIYLFHCFFWFFISINYIMIVYRLNRPTDPDIIFFGADEGGKAKGISRRIITSYSHT